ncbi:type I restriction enzyme HsdR N-terminal domain-containing protein [Cetobacterium sp. 8H]|uniref:type I restriction endonuclease n=1 Tax=Cetobacterium sp. 8H TaxID=2759681 RepID=UPI00163C5E30|nr:type I restriction endonuclease [Cetobacterium sp. 8H]MBC2851952.1 type I restriction enzyme HsdR N-terminal domain-containing protein [Cetobacterium sp. 8H]
MDQRLNELSKKIETYKERVSNEEMTKTAFIMPFFEILGYDTRNPFEFVPEFTADIADLKGEKVDYGIFINDKVEFIVECKNWKENLINHDKQLNRYFNVVDSHIGILTNGIQYKFFTDLEEANKMDKNPFYEFNILDLKEKDLIQLKKFTKSTFDRNKILDTAEELKYLTLLKAYLKNEFDNPSDEFVSCMLSGIFDGIKTAKIKDKFRPLVKKAINEHFNDMLREKLENAFQLNVEDTKSNELLDEAIEVVDENIPVTTEDEIAGLSIIKSLLLELVPNIEKITHKDTLSYFGVLFEDNTRKWICRLYFNSQNKYISFPILENGERTLKEEKIPLTNIFEISKYKERLVEIIQLYI